MAITAFALSISSLNAVIINSSSIEVDFDDFYSGTLLGYTNSSVDRQLYSSSNSYSPLGAGQGFTIQIDNNYGPDVGALYDTDTRVYLDSSGNEIIRYEDLPGHSPVATTAGRELGSEGDGNSGEDTDLEFDRTNGWYGGNLNDERQGNALVIQEHLGISDWYGSVSNSPSALDHGHLYFTTGDHNWDTNNNWKKYAPDDDSNGGTICFDFETNLSSFGFNFVDLDRGEDASITFVDSLGSSATINLDEFSSSSGDFFNRGSNNTSGTVVWGDGKANRVDAISVSELNSVLGTNLNNFEKVSFNLSGSGGISAIHYGYSAVPEPSTVFAGLGLFAFMGLHFFRSRRKSKSTNVA